jgi:virginiamycin B lyase
MARLEGTPISSILTQVSGGSSTNVWGVDAAQNIYQYQSSDGTNWTQAHISGQLKQVSVTSDGTVWGVQTGGQIYRYTGSGWTTIPGQLNQISVASAGAVWGVQTAGQIYHYTGSGWTNIPGTINQISAAADGSLWGVNTAGALYQYVNNSWTHMPTNVAQGGPNIPFTQVAVGHSGFLLALDAQGGIYSYNSMDNGTGIFWEQWGTYPPAQALSAAADNSFVYIDLQGITQFFF